MAWPNETVFEFLDLYRSEPAIWDPKHGSHKNRSEVSEAWERIKNNLSIDCSVLDLKKKKEALMTTFRSQINKKKKCPDYRSAWFAYSFMESFLGGKYECDSTNTDVAEYLDSTTYTKNQPSDPLNFQTFSVSNYTPTSDRQKTRRLSPTKQNIQKRPFLPHPKKENEEPSYRLVDTQGDVDECDLYCQLLAKKLRKLDEHQRDVVMHDIDNLIFRAKMEQTQFNLTGPTSPVPRKTRSPVFIVTASENQFDEENTSFQDHNET